MGLNLSPLQRKNVAEKFLVWLQDKNISTCPKTYDVIRQASGDIDEEIFHIWRAFELLRIMGRLELHSPNGRKGFKVLDYTPLAVYQLRTDGFKAEVETDMLVQVLTDLKRRYKNIWNNALNQLK